MGRRNFENHRGIQKAGSLVVHMTVDNVFHEEQGNGVGRGKISSFPSCGANQGSQWHLVMQYLSCSHVKATVRVSMPHRMDPRGRAGARGWPCGQSRIDDS